MHPTATQIYTQVSIRQLKAIHMATHTGKLAKAGQDESEAIPSAEERPEALEREAAEEAN